MSRRWNPTNVTALSRWLTTRRVAQSAADYANPIEHYQPRAHSHADTVMLALACIAVLLIVLGVI